MSRCTLYHSERVRETLIMHNSHKTHVRLKKKIPRKFVGGEYTSFQTETNERIQTDEMILSFFRRKNTAHFFIVHKNK